MYKLADAIKKVIEECEKFKDYKGYKNNEVKLDDSANTAINGYWEIIYDEFCNPEYRVIVIYINQPSNSSVYPDKEIRYIVEESKTKY